MLKCIAFFSASVEILAHVLSFDLSDVVKDSNPFSSQTDCIPGTNWTRHGVRSSLFIRRVWLLTWVLSLCPWVKQLPSPSCRVWLGHQGFPRLIKMSWRLSSPLWSLEYFVHDWNDLKPVCLVELVCKGVWGWCFQLWKVWNFGVSVFCGTILGPTHTTLEDTVLHGISSGGHFQVLFF